jgi:hypothetical protein
MSMQGHHTAHDDELAQSPFSPPTPEPHQPLLDGNPRSPYPISRRQTNSSNPANNFVSSPLNPRVTGSASSSRSRGPDGAVGTSGLWRMAGADTLSNPLLPPTHRFSQFSVRSHSDASLMSHSEDSKYPQTGGASRPLSGLIAYAYDPLMDHNMPDAEEDPPSKTRGCNWRGVINIGSLVFVTLGVVILFTFYPVISSVKSGAVRTLITGNVRINSSGQAPDL